MTSSAMPCRAALATIAGTIISIVELLSTASRNGTSGSRVWFPLTPSARLFSMSLASLVNWFKSRACDASACSSRPGDPAELRQSLQPSG